jgi:hypothetical protein
LTCPNKQVSEKAYRSQSGQGRSFRFSAQQCQDCPLADRCRGDKLPTSHMRQVFISDHRSVLALARTLCPNRRLHSGSGAAGGDRRFIANLVRYHNGRDAQRRGKPNCDYQVKMNGVAFNLRQWMREIDKRSKASTAASLP